MSKILIIDEKSTEKFLLSALPSYDIKFVASVKDVTLAVRDLGISLFLIGVHFDNSNVLEVIHTIKAMKNHYRKPILLIRILPSDLTIFTRQTAMLFKKVGLISGFFEVNDSEDDEAERLNKLVKSHLGVERTQPE